MSNIHCTVCVLLSQEKCQSHKDKVDSKPCCRWCGYQKSEDEQCERCDLCLTDYEGEPKNEPQNKSQNEYYDIWNYFIDNRPDYIDPNEPYYLLKQPYKNR